MGFGIPEGTIEVVTGGRLPGIFILGLSKAKKEFPIQLMKKMNGATTTNLSSDTEEYSAACSSSPGRVPPLAPMITRLSRFLPARS